MTGGLKDVAVGATTIKRNQDKPETLELIAASIIKVADGLDMMRKSGLTARAIQILLHDVTRVPLYQIEAILDAGPKLRKAMLAPEVK